jgi:hypothetical protein
MENVPLQQRAGKNPDPRAFFFPVGETVRSRYLQASDPDTVMLSGSSKEQRLVPVRQGETYAQAFNFTGGAIDFEHLFVDAQNNEYKVESGSIPDGGSWSLQGLAEGPAILLPNEKLVFRITGGDPSAGDGCNLSISYQTVSRDVVAVRKDIPGTSPVELLSPPAGEVWIPAAAGEEAETLLICNGDTDPHTFDVYVNNGSEDILVAKAVSVLAGEINDIGRFDRQGAFSYGQTLKVEMLEARAVASSRILFAGTLTKAALSKDDTP